MKRDEVLRRADNRVISTPKIADLFPGGSRRASQFLNHCIQHGYLRRLGGSGTTSDPYRYTITEFGRTVLRDYAGVPGPRQVREQPRPPTYDFSGLDVFGVRRA